MGLYRGVTTTLLTLTFAMASALPAVAQKKVAVGGRPAPGQAVRLNIVQDADLDMKPVEAVAGSPLGPMHLKAKTTTVVAIGTSDAKGPLQVDMTYEDISQNVTINDQPAPPEAAEAAAKIKGKTLSMTVDANGEVIDVTPPPDFPMPAAMMKDMLKQALGLMARQEMTVGETVSAPFVMAMPLPMPGDPPQLKGELKSTLTGVSGAAGGEIAALEQVVTAGVDSTMPGPGGSGDITIKMQVTGKGTSDWDVKGGLVKASKMTTSISGTFTIPGVGAMALTGTTIVSLDRVPLDTPTAFSFHADSLSDMADVRPFAALRPRAGLAPRVAAVPYDVVNAEEARALATDALSFLHVSRAEIDLPPDTDPYADAVYAGAVQAQAALRASSLEVESRPAVYLYRLTMGGHVQTGVAAAFSVDEYRRDLVKKHEKTRPDKENDRTRHIIETRAQSGPVLLTYRRHAAVDAAVAAGLEAAPLYEFTAPDGIGHAIWRTEPAVGDAIVQAFRDVPALYISDGHHRAASAARADERLKSGESGAFLGVAFPDTGMQILPYHRAIKDLNGRTPDAFLAEVRSRVTVRPGGPEVARKGECALYLAASQGAGAWYLVALDGGPATSDPVASLDVQRLHDLVLAPVLGIGDERTDKRIDFVGGIRGPAELKRLVDGGKAAVAFAMFPTTIDDLVAIADAGGIMPPKSTWFEPKLRDGLLVHLI